MYILVILQKKHRSKSFNCPVCNKVKDVQHLHMDCDRNNMERKVLLKQLKVNSFDEGLI